MSHLAFAYIGPGAGFAFLGSFLTLLLSLAASLASLLLWPFRMLWGMLRRGRGRQPSVRRVIFLGLDGLDPEVTERLMTEGKLPNLMRLKEQGSYRRLRAGAWRAFATGVHAARYDDCEPFWKILGRHAVGSTILRVPVAFPLEEFGGRLLSGATPDLTGTQGNFSWFSTGFESGSCEGCNRYPLVDADGALEGTLAGPGESVPFRILEPQGEANLEIQKRWYRLKPREYTPWIRLKFGAVRGIVRFLATRTEPDFSLYATAVQIDPEAPAVAISQPRSYAIYLAKLLGSFSTLGVAEDMRALKEGALDEDDFLAQTKLIQCEREAMFFSALEHQRRGVVACVFDTPDRIRQMARVASRHSDAIERMYCDMDRLVGRTLEQGKEKTAVFVLSGNGVLFSNQKLNAEDPGIEDMAPTALRLFGIQPPDWMEGKPVTYLA